MRSECSGEATGLKSCCYFANMPSIEDKNDTEDDEMEQETPESEKSDDEEESESGSGSEEDESSGKNIKFSPHYRPKGSRRHPERCNRKKEQFYSRKEFQKTYPTESKPESVMWPSMCVLIKCILPPPHKPSSVVRDGDVV